MPVNVGPQDIVLYLLDKHPCARHFQYCQARCLLACLLVLSTGSHSILEDQAFNQAIAQYLFTKQLITLEKN